MLSGFENAALDRRIKKLAAQNAKLQLLLYFLFIILLGVASETSEVESLSESWSPPLLAAVGLD